MKNMNENSGKTDRDKVCLWLDHIKEFDEATRAEVFEQCKNDTEARKYYVGRFNEIK